MHACAFTSGVYAPRKAEKREETRPGRFTATIDIRRLTWEIRDGEYYSGVRGYLCERERERERLASWRLQIDA